MTSDNSTGLLDGKVAIVTGGGRGIGRGVALVLAGMGAKIVVNDYGVDIDGSTPRAGPADETVAEIRAGGGEAIAHLGSVAEEADAAGLVDACLSAYGRVDILVNTAGIIIRSLLVDTPADVWDRQVAVHMRGHFLCCRAVAPAMIGQGFGRIVNFTSLSGLVGLPGSNGYTVAKSGILGLTWMLAQELGLHGITVNAISPSAVTRMADLKMPQGVGDLRRALGISAAMQPKAATMDASAVGAGVAYLASDEAGYVNGQIIGIAGDRLELWSQPRIVASAFCDGNWTVEALRSRFRSTIGRDMSNPAQRGAG